MKYINLHLLTFILGLIALISFNWQYGNETFIFYGFAENKEMEIRLEHSAQIDQIHVTSGNKVSKGTVLLEVNQTDLDLAQSDLNHEIAELQSQFKIWEASTKASIAQLKSQRSALESEILSQIDQMESEISIKKSLLKDLESIKPATDSSGKSPNQIKIEGLKRELKLVVQPLDSEIKKLQNELYSSQNPLKIQIDKLKNQLGFSQEAEDQLKILAPGNGIIGSLFCKEGEQVSSFNTLLTFYEENPTQVKAYVLESLLLNVSLGDSVIVQSVIQSGSKCKGKIVGMGSRIIEIPERLRKNPTFKTYGREIQIEIPSHNQFLQKEKVILKLPPKEGHPENKIIKAFTTPKITSNSQNE
jgi:multidrug resistance efflux pump